MSRRNFFHLMGASAGLAGIGVAAAGCRRYEKEEIVRWRAVPRTRCRARRCEYATVYDLAGVAHPLLATSFEGRPIHLDGNPEHPFSGGGVVPADEAPRPARTRSRRRRSFTSTIPIARRTRLDGGKGASLDSFKVALAELRKTIGHGRRARARGGD